MPPVALQLGLAGTAGANGAFLTLQMLPHAGETGQQVFVLGQGYLKPSLAGPRPLGKNVQNKARPVHHRHPQLLGEHPLLGGGQGVVKDDQIRPQASCQLPDFFHLSLADEGAGVGTVLVLQHRAQAGAAGGVQQSGQLLQRIFAGVLRWTQPRAVKPHQHRLVDFLDLLFLKHNILLTSKAGS